MQPLRARGNVERTRSNGDTAPRERETNRQCEIMSPRNIVPRALFFPLFHTDTLHVVTSMAFFFSPLRDRPRIRGRWYLAGVISRHGLTHMCAALCRRPRRKRRWSRCHRLAGSNESEMILSRKKLLPPHLSSTFALSSESPLDWPLHRGSDLVSRWFPLAPASPPSRGYLKS